MRSIRSWCSRCLLSATSGWRGRALVSALVIGLALPATAWPAGAFMINYQLVQGGSTFTFAVAATPQWTLVTDGGATTYVGVFDSATFGMAFALSFKDQVGIKRNGSGVEAQLKGKISLDCNSARITLKDMTNDRTIVLTGAGVNCIAN